MEFPFGVTVYRDRRKQVPDPYNPALTTAGDWDPEQTVELEQAFVASSSSTSVSDATRSQLLTSKSLFLSDPEADVRPGDRIRVGAAEYFVHVRPEADVNPFTGWQPAVEIPLELVEG
jgi:hypothetical protein